MFTLHQGSVELGEMEIIEFINFSRFPFPSWVIPFIEFPWRVNVSGCEGRWGGILYLDKQRTEIHTYIMYAHVDLHAMGTPKRSGPQTELKLIVCMYICTCRCTCNGDSEEIRTSNWIKVNCMWGGGLSGS
jgi:hypothetical protein